MDDKRKIVLATEDILAKNLEDIFINVNLQQNFNQIRKEKFDNNFDLSEQFRKERNSSRSFRVYGIIDSPVVNCTPKFISVYSDSGLTQLIEVVQSTQIGFGDKNVFGKYRGKFLIELNDYTTSSDIWIEIKSDGVNYGGTVVKIPLVFYGADGEFVEYGTNTVDFGLNGDFVNISNDFPFFYNKHWIKKSFQLEKVLKRNVSFDKLSLNLEEGSIGEIVVFLNDVSRFGNESVDVLITTPSDSTYEIASQFIDFEGIGFSWPITLKWAIGEQYKILDISAIKDYLYEKNIEYFTIELLNPSNSTLGNGVINIKEMTINIINTDENKSIVYNFQKIIQNTTPVSRLNFSANLTASLDGTNLNVFGAEFTGYVNGIMIDNQNQRFYPNDSFELEIINRGNRIVLSPIPGISFSERVLEVDDSFIFTVNSKYDNQSTLPLDTAVLNFKYDRLPEILTDSYTGNFYINGIEFSYIYITAANFVEEVNRVYSELNIEMPFSISKSGPTVTLTAKHPANTVNVLIPEGVATILEYSSQDASGYSEQDVPRFALVGDVEVPEYQVPNGVQVGAGVRNKTITPQIPFEISLNANFANNTQCKYEFKIRKPGYKEVIIPSQEISVNSSLNGVFLISGIKNVIGPNVSVGGGQLVCGNNDTNVFNPTGYLLNGLALLSKENVNTIFDKYTNITNRTYEGVNAINNKIIDDVEVLPYFSTHPISNGVIECNNLIEISNAI